MFGMGEPWLSLRLKLISSSLIKIYLAIYFGSFTASFAPGLVLSEFESFMTGLAEKKWNLFLAQFSSVFFFITSFFIIICQVIIKMFFKLEKTVVKQRYKSVLSFKIIRIVLGLFFILPFLVGLTFVDYFGDDKQRLTDIALPLPLPFIIAILGNIILLVYLTGNEEAWQYLMAKIKAFKEEILFGMEMRKIHKRQRSNKVVDISRRNLSNCAEDQKETRRAKVQSVYVIDLENPESVFDETSL